VARDASRGDQPDLERIIGTSLDKGDELDALAKLMSEAPEAREALIVRAAAGEKGSAKTAAKQQRRAAREAELAAKIIALPAEKFGVIYADPEWRFEPWSRETGMDRAADNHFATSEIDAIKARDVRSIAADDCVLFLWSTAPMQPQAYEVMAAWGFDYKSQTIWDKGELGTGYWFRNRHEVLLVGTLGAIPAPALGTQWPSIIEAPVGQHSEKPKRFHDLIEAYFPNLPKIELNARRSRTGWASWGTMEDDDSAN
jgi:N6-adenosine-specific RNA methylase IME4